MSSCKNWIGDEFFEGDRRDECVSMKSHAALRAEVERLKEELEKARFACSEIALLTEERAALRAKLAAVETVASPALPGGEYAEGWNACAKMVRVAIREEKP